MLNNGVPRYYFEVKKGYTGQVKNTFNIVGVAGNGQSFNKNYDTADINTINGPRTATIVSKASAPAPIGEIAIELLDQNGGEVLRGGNRMKITFKNSSSSTVTITEPLEAVVLLPLGVTLKSNPNATYTDKNGQSSTGNYQILTNNYNGTGRQLVKIKWNDDRIRIGGNLTAELDVNISNSAPNSLQFDVYGFSGNNALRVPTSSGTNITNTILQTDTDDLNKDNKTNTPRLKSGNIYTIRGHYDIQTEKLVKGALDSDFTYFGHTTPGGSIEYKIRLTNTTGKNITEMTLIDVLPSIGDLGITDNVARDSQFTPIMMNSIVLPTQWQNKVNIYYSTAKKPKRDDLTKNTIYPDTTTQLSNPAGAENPNWKTAAQVTDWSSIHSFKIELKDGVEWLNGQNIEIQFKMQAPSELKVNRDVLDKTINPTERAAWNSFAVATDHGQPVEPMRVGVYMDYDIEDPKVEKTVNDSKNPLELNDRNELFTWKIDYDFGNYIGNWNSVVLSDQIHELLTIESVKVVNQVGQDVTTNGTVNITNNLVTFTLNKQNNSFNYLKGQTYTLIIESKIKQSATDDQLGPYIQSGGIPNQAKLVVDNNPTNSNEVKVIPPILGEVQITKVDDKTRGVLEGAQFELRKCPNEHSSVDDCVLVSSGTSDTNGKISFKDIKMGYYKLVETKAPEGYRILTKPIDIPLLDINNRVLTIEVENSQNGWELPSSGGMGTYPFYILGAVLMIGSVFMLKKRKKAK